MSVVVAGGQLGGHARTRRLETCGTAGTGTGTTRAVHKFSHRLYADLSFGPVKDDSGSVLGSVAMGRDCSDRFLAEKALRERIAELERSTP